MLRNRKRDEISLTHNEESGFGKLNTHKANGWFARKRKKASNLSDKLLLINDGTGAGALAKVKK